MENELDGLLDEPIPGESLTVEMGAFPWQRPPQLSTVDETVMHYSDKLSQPKISEGFIAVLDSGVSVKTLTNSLINSNVMNGTHTIDVAMLITPVVLEMMMYLGDSAGIVYTTGLEEDKDNPVVEQAVMHKVMNKFRNKEENIEPETVPIMNEPVAPRGLMARPMEGAT